MNHCIVISRKSKQDAMADKCRLQAENAALRASQVAGELVKDSHLI